MARVETAFAEYTVPGTIAFWEYLEIATYIARGAGGIYATFTARFHDPKYGERLRYTIHCRDGTVLGTYDVAGRAPRSPFLSRMYQGCIPGYNEERLCVLIYAQMEDEDGPWERIDGHTDIPFP